MDRDRLLQGLPLRGDWAALDEQQKRVVLLRLIRRILDQIDSENRIADEYEAEALGTTLACIPYDAFLSSAVLYCWRAMTSPADRGSHTEAPIPPVDRSEFKTVLKQLEEQYMIGSTQTGVPSDVPRH